LNFPEGLGFWLLYLKVLKVVEVFLFNAHFLLLNVRRVRRNYGPFVDAGGLEVVIYGLNQRHEKFLLENAVI